MKAEGNYSELFLTDGENRIVSANLSEVQKQLIGEQFKRLGRSVLINLKYLSSYNRKAGTCTLKHNDLTFELKVSPKFLKEL